MKKERPLPGGGWFVGMGAELALIGYTVYGLLEGFPFAPLFRAPELAGPACIVTGFLILGWGYVTLKTRVSDLSRPATLVTRDGPLRWIRHPMYLGEMLWMAGFALLSGDPLASGLALSGGLGLFLQTRREESALKESFPAEHAEWRSRSWNLIPCVY